MTPSARRSAEKKRSWFFGVRWIRGSFLITSVLIRDLSFPGLLGLWISLCPRGIPMPEIWGVLLITGGSIFFVMRSALVMDKVGALDMARAIGGTINRRCCQEAPGVLDLPSPFLRGKSRNISLSLNASNFFCVWMHFCNLLEPIQIPRNVTVCSQMLLRGMIQSFEFLAPAKKNTPRTDSGTQFVEIEVEMSVDFFTLRNINQNIFRVMCTGDDFVVLDNMGLCATDSWFHTTSSRNIIMSNNMECASFECTNSSKVYTSLQMCAFFHFRFFAGLPAHLWLLLGPPCGACPHSIPHSGCPQGPHRGLFLQRIVIHYGQNPPCSWEPAFPKRKLVFYNLFMAQREWNWSYIPNWFNKWTVPWWYHGSMVHWM